MSADSRLRCRLDDVRRIMTTDTLRPGKRPRQPRDGRPLSSRYADSRDVDLGPLPNLIGYAIRQAQIAIFQDFRRSFAKFNIRPIQYGVLAVIDSNPGLKQSQVCTALGIKRANFVPLLNDLERRSLAERRSAKDQRANALYLTKKGVRLMQKFRKINKAHERRVAAGLSGDEHAKLIQLLNRIQKAVDGSP